MSSPRTRGKKVSSIGIPPIPRADAPTSDAGTAPTPRIARRSFRSRGVTGGQGRYFVRRRSEAKTCRAVGRAAVGKAAGVLNTDEWRGYARVQKRMGIAHVTVRHGQAGRGLREWARDDDHDGVREVHCNGCEGAGAPLRTFLRMFRGGHKKYLADYVAPYETMTNAKRITPDIIRRMCLSKALSQSKKT